MAFLIILAVVAVIIVVGAGVMTAIRFQDAIFGSLVLLVGLGLIAGGVALLVNLAV